MEFGTIWKKLVRRNDPHTSQEAAKSVKTSYPYSTVTARFRSLLDKGYIIDTGFTRPGRSGRKQRVLIIKELSK